jgi:hypothetical protein
VEVDVLKNWGSETELRKKWVKKWEQLGARILKFPKWMQTIILEDVNCAIQNRIATMEMILISMKKTGRMNHRARAHRK